MKRIGEHVILYDAACSMCNLYTKGFQKAGMLDNNGRLPYQDKPDNLSCLVDQERFVNGIALVHTATGKVYYGVDSLLRIIMHSFPVLKPFSHNKTFIKMVDMLYKIISFNSQVIMPAGKKEMQNPALNPSFHRGYRVAYLVITCFFTAFVLHQYSFRLDAILPQSSFFRELLICGGQLLWQGVAVIYIGREKAWEYLGHMMTVSLAGSSLLAAVMLIIGFFTLQNAFVYLVLFGITVGLMLLEHIRRTRILALDWKLSASWVFYRVMIVVILIVSSYAA